MSDGGVPYDMWEGFVILGLVSVIVVIIMFLSHMRKLDIGKDFGKALVIGGIQLFAVAAFLTWLFDFSLWYFPIWLLLGLMVSLGGYQSAKRAGNMPKAWQVTTPAILGGSASVLAVLALTRAMPMQPHFIVPLAGMAFGNSMRLCSMSLDRLIREVRLNRTAVETALSLGADSGQAMESYGRISVRAALIPTIDNLKTLGIIFIPGAMAGLLIGGVDPIVAAQYQLIIFLMIIGGGLITAMLVVQMAGRKLFTEAHQLEDWV